MRKPADKLFVVRKYIRAQSAAQAIRRDKLAPVDDVFVDEEWARGTRVQLADAIGFSVERDDE